MILQDKMMDLDADRTLEAKFSGLINQTTGHRKTTGNAGNAGTDDDLIKKEGSARA